MVRVALLAAVSLAGGLIFGLHLGTIGIYTVFHQRNADCTINEDMAACVNNQHVSCVWDNSTCLFPDLIVCKDKPESTCVDECVWDYSDDGSCKHVSGWASWQSGLFSSGMIMGAIFSSLTTGYLLDRFGRKKVYGGIGLITLIGAVAMSLGRLSDDYALLIVARVIIGLGIGATCVTTPLYTGEMSPAEWRGPLGMSFQIGVTNGQLLMAFLGFILEPPSSGARHWEARIHFGIILPCAIGSVLMIVLSFLMDESKAWLEKQSTLEDPSLPLLQSESQTWTKAQVALPLVVATVLSIVTQMTGINAIMNYGPQIMKSAGLSELPGNFYLIAWNMAMSTLSIPISKKLPSRQMYLGATVLCISACFLTAVPTFPTVAAEKTKHIIASLGIGLFLFAFQVGMGSCFFKMATELFPPSFREMGCSITNMINLVFNLIVAFGFPVAVEALSGGASGNQDKGMATVFTIFGSIGVIGVVFLCRFLQPYDDSK